MGLFNPKTWFDGSGGGTPVTAAELNRMETGIAQANTVPLSTKTAAYTLVVGDASTVVEFNAAGAVTLTVPTNAAAAFPVGAVVGVRQYGAGQVTVAPASGVTIRSRGDALKTAGQYAEATLTKRATDEWVLVGDVTT